MRNFVVCFKIDKLGTDGEVWSEIDMQLFDASNLPELFNKVNKYRGSDVIIYNAEGTEQEILDRISESNGDGDYYFMVGELITDNGKIEMKTLLQ